MYVCMYVCMYDILYVCIYIYIYACISGSPETMFRKLMPDQPSNLSPEPRLID